MAGHSKWANIRHRKGAQDAFRSKEFAKLSKEVMVAAALGGNDPDTNASLRLAISKARAKSMPKKNIEKAISKGSGEVDASSFKEIIYAGNVRGISFLINCLSNNVNRVAANMQSYFNKAGGSLSGPSSVHYIFDRKGILEFSQSKLNEEETMMMAIEAGADDFISTENTFIVYTEPNVLQTVKDILEENSISEFITAEVAYVPNQEVKLPFEKANKIIAFIDKLEDDEDIQEVFHNLDADSLTKDE
ncbi:YebC/PmpR family DNA-binding transcriptional regulator [Candidatus Mycoplasma mahonii]|uniref:YebC/PmpR family DNA-binding transcriptional regulator n=1 Tax=Candidatus Mycoplasma mahonii TaxID=3004105 RepID=UPI0026EC0070|nr:YebC/PmpR family DNA-binding transcriptional regulator [Candidatus Mycoplasma mahonii]WKX02320.1 YebC/PmpR family DNA-binding transcriptional regulator [Candidatus Mycoplasma mahonii]